MPKMVVVGRIGSPYGLKGWMKLFSYTQPVQNIGNYKTWYLQAGDQWQPLAIENIEIKFNTKGYFHIKFADCQTPEQAQRYNHLLIAVTRDQLPQLLADDYYWSDLEGLEVVNQQGISFGKVSSLFSTGANDVLVIKGNRERLIPYIKEVVLAVDLTKGEIKVDWDEDF